MSLLWAAAGIASLTAAFAGGDLDETARQGELAGPVVVEKALHSTNRQTKLAGIVAAPAVVDAAELIPDLADLVAGPDRRTAVPAAQAVVTIAKKLGKRDLPDDLVAEDLEASRAAFEAIARDGKRAVDVRLAALDACVALAHVLDPKAVGFDAKALAADPDKDVARVAAQLAK